MVPFFVFHCGLKSVTSDVEKMKFAFCFNRAFDKAHRGPIYALDWHSDGHLLSAGSDATVKVWDIGTPEGHDDETTVLEHPSYVYAAKFYPNDSNLLASAGYDHVIR